MSAKTATEDTYALGSGRGTARSWSRRSRSSSGWRTRCRFHGWRRSWSTWAWAAKDGRLLDAALEDLATITGQKAVVTKARKSIAGFKLREGMAIGAKVTLRGAYMWEFVDRLVSLALPRIRDFRGLSPAAFDGRGNYTLGVTEQLIFPEIDYDKVVKVTGMDITIVTTATDDDEGRALLAALGFPFAQSAAEAS